MTLRQDDYKLQKYLKPTQAASYGANVGYGREFSLPRPWTGRQPRGLGFLVQRAKEIGGQ